MTPDSTAVRQEVADMALAIQEDTIDREAVRRYLATGDPADLSTCLQSTNLRNRVVRLREARR